MVEENSTRETSLRLITLEFLLSTSLVVLSQTIQKPKDMFHRYLVTAIVFPILHEGVETVWKSDTTEIIIPKSKPKRRKLLQVSKTVKCRSDYPNFLLCHSKRVTLS